MATVFNGVLEAGIYGSVTVLAVLLFRLLFRKVPGKWLCLLWLLAFARLAMPFQIESRLSLQPDSIRFEQTAGAVSTVLPTVPVQTMTPAVPEDAELPEDVSVSYGDAMTVPTAPSDVLMQTPSPVQPDGETHLVIDWMAVCGWIWLVGCVCFLGYGLASYLQLKRRVREAVRCDDGAWECPGLETAFILGFLKPRLYVPMGTSFGREYILTHERSHIARGDHWWKLISYLILAVHWFNPLVWLAYLLLCRDMERACDERVIKNMSLDQRKAYSTALLRCSANRSRIAACPVAFGEISVKDRIKNVLNYRKPGFWAVCAGILALVFVAVCLMTSPAKPDLEHYLTEAREDLSGAFLNTKVAFVGKDTEEEIRRMSQFLADLRFELEPVSTDAPDGEALSYNLIRLEYGDETIELMFSEDYTRLWARIGEKQTPVYKVLAPEYVSGFMEAELQAVVHRPTSGEPFATANDNLAWTQGIHLDAVRTARIRRQSPRVDNSVSTSSGAFFLPEFEEFLEILNRLPQSAFAYRLVDAKYDPMEFGRDGGLVVTVQDEVNHIEAWIRLENDTVELFLADQYADPDWLYGWVIRDGDLLNYMKEMNAHPPVVTMWGWYGFDTLDRCRVALELLKAQKSYHILVEANYEGNPDVLIAKVETEYWKDGDTRLLREFPVSDTATWWLREESGMIYEKLECAAWISSDMQPYNWREAEDQYRQLLIPWFEQFVWVDSQISLEGWEVTEAGEIITISVSEADVSYLLTLSIDSIGNLTRIVRHGIAINGEPIPGSVTTTVLETGTAVDTTMLYSPLDEIMLQKCVNAMVELQKSQELSLYMDVFDSNFDGYATYMYSARGWLIEYKNLNMDYENVKWLSYDGQQYIYDEVFDEQGDVTAPYQWQKDPESYEFSLPYPLDLDWGNIPLVYQHDETTWGGEGITLFYPEQDRIFTFRFSNLSGGSKLTYLTVRDTDGKKLIEMDPDYSARGSAADCVAAEYAEAVSQIGAAPAVRDEAFYEELFTRKTDGAYTTRLTYELFVAFYRDPAEFARQLSRKYTEDPEQAKDVLLHMSNQYEFQAPGRFLEMIAQLRNNPNVNQQIVDLLEDCYPYK